MKQMKKHCFLLISLWLCGMLVSTAQSKLDPAETPKFVHPLPIPQRIDATEGGFFGMSMQETTQTLGIYHDGSPLATPVWGYGAGATVTYPGPTFIAKKDVAVNVRWENKLPDEHLLPVDQSLHWANPEKGIATVTHLHGGHTESASDGLPEAWYTQNYRETGAYFKKRVYHYSNDQEAATLWYHDHALGITRLNVYAGLAGFYLLRDDNELEMINTKVLPSGPYEVEVVIQDRMFKENGALFFPAFPGEPAYDDFITGEGAVLPPEEFPDGGPTVLAEFFGDFILVNGVAWPHLQVEPRKYRFRMLNGSDSRFYILRFNNNKEFLQIGTDNGFLYQPEAITELTLAPGERADLIVDFTGDDGAYLTLQNFGPDEPFKGAAAGQQPADPSNTGQIMQFRVDLPKDLGVPDASVDESTILRPDVIPAYQMGEEDNVRKLALFEGSDEFGRLQPMLGIVDESSPNNGSLTWSDPITENPMINDTEIWEIYNATEDAHPIHLHLVAFRIIDRESFTADISPKQQIQHNGTIGEGGVLSNIVKVGDATPPAPNEAGWKDTFTAPPGTVTRVIATFDRRGRYVWHCHILSHEDHEMMRPYFIGPIPGGGRAPITGAPEISLMQSELPADAGRPVLRQNQPNPFGQMTQISFELPESSAVSIDVYRMNGQLVRRLADGWYDSGQHQISWDGRDEGGNLLTSGLYLYRLKTEDEIQTKQLTIIR